MGGSGRKAIYNMSWWCRNVKGRPSMENAKTLLVNRLRSLYNTTTYATLPAPSASFGVA